MRNKKVRNKRIKSFFLSALLLLSLVAVFSCFQFKALKAKPTLTNISSMALNLKQGVAEQKEVLLSPFALNIANFHKKYNSFVGAEEKLNKYLQIPFRADGALNNNGEWVTWQNPNLAHQSPGFNCSGFLLAAHQTLFNSQISFNEAKFDRKKNSGPNSKLGEDWDFGLDLVLNLAQEVAGRSLNNLSETLIKENTAPLGAGIDIHSPEFFEYLAKMKPGYVYYFVISRPEKRFEAGLAYYHVGLILPNVENNLWVYHTTLQGNTYRADLNNPNGKNRFLKAFPKKNYGQRRILFVEIPL